MYKIAKNKIKRFRTEATDKSLVSLKSYLQRHIKIGIAALKEEQKIEIRRHLERRLARCIQYGGIIELNDNGEVVTVPRGNPRRNGLRYYYYVRLYQ